MGIEHRQINITPTVDSVVQYKWRDEFIQKLISEYQPGYKYNITLPTDLLERDSYNFYRLQVQLPDGEIKAKRLNLEAFHTITSFANIKIRARMLHLYAEAERRNLVVVGTTNRTEFILGDFCKYGDGGTDIEPLSYLYKNQIYQLAEYLQVIPEIIERKPSPDTFSLPVSDQEFFFRIPFDKLDFLLYAWEHEVSISETANTLEISEDAVARAFKDFTSKNRATAHLREMPGSLD
jgi:NAD+ synthase